MSSVLLKILRMVHLARRYIGRTSTRWALFVAILGRKLSEWWCRPGKPGPSKPADSSFPFNLCSSAPGGPAVLREFGVAASNVPASASQGSLRIDVGAEGQPATAPPTRSPTPAILSVEQSYGGPSYLDAGHFVSRSSSNVSFASTQSRASERLSRITASRESLHARVGQPTALPRSPHHQFGRGPDPSRSGGRLSRSPSPMCSLDITQQHHHLDVTQTAHSHAGGGISPTDGPPSPAAMPSVHVHSPSSESLPIPTNLQPLTEEPMAISPTQPPIPSSVTDHHETASQRPSFVASEYYLPEGRFLQLINSEQVPRYIKDIKMQVDTILTFIQYLNLLTDPVRKGSTLWSP
jgi:hypothetical protein